MTTESTTHFGRQTVPLSEKVAHVREVFDHVTPKYDLMNDLMSFGMHRLWKDATVRMPTLSPNSRILDLAGGTGDMTLRLATRYPFAEIVMADINNDMLTKGRDRLIDKGFCKNICFVQLDAEKLPFPPRQFDAITIAFGLRNVTGPKAALASMQKTLKPGGQALILEFSHPILPGLQPLYQLYSEWVIPALGQCVTGSKDAYQYLIESIEKHPNQNTLKSWMLEAGFDRVDVHNFAGGIVALHRGFVF